MGVWEGLKREGGRGFINFMLLKGGRAYLRGGGGLFERRAFTVHGSGLNLNHKFCHFKKSISTVLLLDFPH